MKYNWETMTEQQKIKATQEEIDLCTHNGTTKDDLINILRWLWDKFEVEEDLREEPRFCIDKDSICYGCKYYIKDCEATELCVNGSLHS